jgi:prevent-host-death family protein
MPPVNVREAKTHLSRFLDDAAAGEEIIITKAGKPVAKLVGLSPTPTRKKGLLKGHIRIGKAFGLPLPKDVLQAFERPR